MSKLNCNFVKSKIESIAKNPPLNINNSNENKLNISTKTLKDSFSYLEEFKESFKKQLNIKKVETTFMKNNTNIDWHKNNNISSLLTKGSSGYFNINDSDKENKEDNIEMKQKEKLNKKIKNENLIKEINIEEINELKEIYNDLFILFLIVVISSLI